MSDPGTVEGASSGDVQGGSAGAALPAAEGADWQRLHPVSPFLRGGVMVLAVGGYVISQQFERLVGISWGPQGPEDPTFGHFWLALLAGLALVALVVGYGWLSWRVAGFRIGLSTLEYRWGLLFKQHRQVRYDRIQSVDVSRPLLARLFGLSQVVVQSAGGADSHVELAYLTHGRSLQVRDTVLSLVDAEDRPSGSLPAADEAGLLPEGRSEGRAAARPPNPYAFPGIDALVRGDVAPTRGREVLRTIRVPMSRLVASLVYHPVTVLVALVIPTTVILAIFTSVAVLPILVPVFFGAVFPHVRRFLTEANFSVAVESDRVRITHGLTDQRSNTVPLARIQAVEIAQGLFWRWPDWWRMRVTIAGVVGENTDSQTTAFPVGTEEEVLDLAAILLPGTDSEALVAGMRGSGGEPGFTTSSRRSAVFQPWAWRRNGYAVTDTALVVRRGRLARVVALVPHARVQSLRVEQGPLDRRRGIATVHADLTAGPVSGAVPHLDVPEAHRLLTEQSARSALARAGLRRPVRLGATPTDAGEPTGTTTEGSAQL